jgi:hypothetical protein
MVANIMDLGMAVMAAGNTIIGPGSDDLVEFYLAISAALFGKSRLQESTAAATAIIIRFIRGHFDDIFFPHHRFNNKPQIVGDWVTKTLSDNLAGILDGEFYLAILVPVGIDLQSPFTNPFCIVLIY